MDKLKGFITEHRKAAIIGLFLIIVFIGGSAMSAINVADRRAQESQQEETTETGTQEETGEEEAETEEEVELTEEQQEAIEGYDDDTTAFIETLCASVWASDTGHTLRFEEDTYTEVYDGDAITHTYAITHLELSRDQSGASLATAVFVTDNGTHLVEYVSETGSSAADSGEVTSYLSSSTAFDIADGEYTAATAVESVTISGLNSAVTGLLDDKTDELTQELSTWCAQYYPTVTTAEWSGTAFIDYSNSLVQLDFDLTGETSVAVSVIYHTDTGTFDFGV